VSNQRRSIVIDGKVTSILLEAAFWNYLDAQAERAALSWAEYVRLVVQEIGPVANRAAAIKEFLLQRAIGIDQDHGTAKQANVILRWEIAYAGSSSTVQVTRQALVSMGRSARCDVIVDDKECSRLHAVAFKVDNAWWLVDLESKNGVWIGKGRVLRCRLKSGQWFTMGESRIRLLEPTRGARD